MPDSYYFKLENSERERAESAINRAIARLRESDAERETPLTLTSEVIVGRPAETIIETAKRRRAELVVLGSHGYSGFTRFLLGSVTDAGFFIGLERGYFREQWLELEVTAFDSAARMVAPLSAGQLDISSQDLRPRGSRGSGRTPPGTRPSARP